MESIDIRKLDFNSFNKLNPLVHTESELYKSEEFVYKIFNDLSEKYSKKKEQKIDYISSIKDEKSLVLPKEKVVLNKMGKRYTLKGYKMDYINGETLYEKQFNLSFDEYIRLINNISLSIKRIHKRSDGFIFGDLNFFNILVDKNLNHYFVDLDSIKFSNIKNERVSTIVAEYLEYRKINSPVNKNIDKLTIFLQVIDYIFSADIWDVSNYDYDYLSEKIEFLKKIKPLFIELKKQNRALPKIPYMDEIIELEENNEIKRRIL